MAVPYGAVQAEDNLIASLPVTASQTIAKGDMVMLTSGYLVIGAHTTGSLFAGVALESITTGTVITESDVIKVALKGRLRVKASANLDATNVGIVVYVNDKETVQSTGTAVKCGRIKERLANRDLVIYYQSSLLN